MPRDASVAQPPARTEADAASGTLDWLRRELDRAWTEGDAPKARLLARLADDVRRQRDERASAKPLIPAARTAPPPRRSPPRRAAAPEDLAPAPG